MGEAETESSRLVRLCLEAACESLESVERWRMQRRTLESMPAPLADALLRELLLRRLLFPSLLENGDTYAGEYFLDKMHGFGVYRFANGHRYEGTWHEGSRQGLGMYTFSNGETQSGHWKNASSMCQVHRALLILSPLLVFIIPQYSMRCRLHLAIFQYHLKHASIWELLVFVDEARRAAEQAYDVAKVHERVNRAVAAAIRAADAASGSS